HAAIATLEGLETAQIVVLAMLVFSRRAARVLLTPLHLRIEIVLVLKRVRRRAVRRDQLIDPPKTIVDLLHDRIVRRLLVRPRDDATDALVEIVRKPRP